METFGVSRATVGDAARSHSRERQVPVEYVEGVCRPAAAGAATTSAAGGFRAGEPVCAVPEVSGTERDGGGQGPAHRRVG
jgi:hypothetical protein